MNPGPTRMQFSLRTLLKWFTLCAVLAGVSARLHANSLYFCICFVAVYVAANSRNRQFNVAAVLVVFTTLAAFAFHSAQGSRRPSLRSPCDNHNRHVALSLLYSQERNGQFPPAYTVDDQGNPLHSWRTLLLPFLDRSDLLNRVALNQPWNSPSNRFLAEVPWLSYVCGIDPSVVKARMQNDDSAPVLRNANVLAIVGPGFVFQGSVPTKLQDITDPHEQTILFIDVPKSSIPWPEPRDFTWEEIRQQAGARGGLHFLSGPMNSITVTCVDGMPRSLPNNIPLEDLHALLTISGGENVDPFIP